MPESLPYVVVTPYRQWIDDRIRELSKSIGQAAVAMEQAQPQSKEWVKASAIMHAYLREASWLAGLPMDGPLLDTP
jgi:hypothetical protein